MDWQLQEAKSRFSELVRRTLEEGPQTVTRHGEEVAVLVPAGEYRRLTGETGGKPDFKEFLMSAPEGLELIQGLLPERDYPREPDLGVKLERPGSEVSGSELSGSEGSEAGHPRAS